MIHCKFRFACVSVLYYYFYLRSVLVLLSCLYQSHSVVVILLSISSTELVLFSGSYIIYLIDRFRVFCRHPCLLPSLAAGNCGLLHVFIFYLRGLPGGRPPSYIPRIPSGGSNNTGISSGNLWPACCIIIHILCIFILFSLHKIRTI